MQTVFRDIKGAITIDLFEKCAIVNNTSYCELRWPYFISFIE